MELDVRLDGFDDPIGSLSSDDRGALRFTYAKTHLQRPNALALSLALPLNEASFEDFAARAYFDNLLQERDSARADVIAKYRLATDDIVGILSHLGKDCAGAVSVLPPGTPPTKVPGHLGQDYRPYSDREVAAIVEALYRREPLPQELADPSPLAGVQSKIAITVLTDGRFAEPVNGAPTTPILKVPQERYERDAGREHIAMTLSSDWFPTAATKLLQIAGIPVLLVERFDRRVENGYVTRIHQEDFCQALGLPARHKYQRPERGATGYNVAAIRSVLDLTDNPAGERLKFLHITLFDILLGNVDGHAKNFALFHRPAARSGPHHATMSCRPCWTGARQMTLPTTWGQRLHSRRWINKPWISSLSHSASRLRPAEGVSSPLPLSRQLARSTDRSTPLTMKTRTSAIS